MPEQMQLVLWDECQPGRCPHELRYVDTGDDGNFKSECDLTVEPLGHPTWTNCRVWGSCTLGGES